MEYMALMKDPDLQPLWKRCFGNEAGRLFQGIRDIPGTDTSFFVELTNIPKDRKIVYGKIVFDYKPHKKEKERVRLSNLHRGHHNIQNLDQQHSFHKGCGHDDDGHYKILFGHYFTSL
jgi:hypothetical protein